MHHTQPLHKALRQKPRDTAIVFGQRRHTFARLADRVARLAAVLRSLGLQTGDRVGMLALNSDRYLEFYYGVWGAGGVVNPVNVRWSPAEIAYSLDDCDTRIFLVDDQFQPMCDELRARSNSLRTLVHAGDGPVPEGTVGRSLIAGYKCPRSVEFALALPLSATGKVLKHNLREPYWDGRERRVA